jgi:uracil-DNA glycosylase family 4
MAEKWFRLGDDVNEPQTIVDVLAEIRRSLEHMALGGLKGFDCSQEALDRVKRWGEALVTQPESIETVRADLGDCRRCKLAGSRTHIVFGEGDADARLVFVGEGPGQEEDRQGRPFVGAAGRLLTRIIEAMRLTRSQVYICNIVKCRPPSNRNPEADEINACLPFLKRQIEAIGPEFLCTLGSVATRSLLGGERPISLLRGEFHDWMGVRVMPTYHPAYLLRNPDKKREVWQDIQKLMQAMGIS